MPKKKRAKPLYQRGKYKLYPRAGRNLEIVWYDTDAQRERGISARTQDVEQGALEVDRLYLESQGHRICPHCRRPWDEASDQLALTAIADYLLSAEDQIGFVRSARNRLSHITNFIAATDVEVRCHQIDEDWIGRFRKWRGKQSWRGKAISLSHIEGSVMQFAAAINKMAPPAKFKPQKMADLARTPTYRVDIPTIAAMFRYAMANPRRENLLRFLRASVATWARPDAIYDIAPAQWEKSARVLRLNPTGRRQTKKHRPTVPVAHQFAAHLDAMTGQYVPISSIQAAWETMRNPKTQGYVPLPVRTADGGPYLIRRSISTIARSRLGEADWIQGRMMLGHVKSSTSDFYAIPNPAHLGKALAVTEQIIDEIEALAPGAFYRKLTADCERQDEMKSAQIIDIKHGAGSGNRTRAFSMGRLHLASKTAIFPHTGNRKRRRNASVRSLHAPCLPRFYRRDLARVGGAA